MISDLSVMKVLWVVTSTLSQPLRAVSWSVDNWLPRQYLSKSRKRCSRTASTAAAIPPWPSRTMLCIAFLLASWFRRMDTATMQRVSRSVQRLVLVRRSWSVSADQRSGGTSCSLG